MNLSNYMYVIAKFECAVRKVTRRMEERFVMNNFSLKENI